MHRKNLKKCSYETLRFEAENFFETTDPRIIEKYIGRPKSRIKYPCSTVTRQDVIAGKIAQFHYMNEREVASKKGLAEVLGFITQESGQYTLHHEKMPYYTIQTEVIDSSSEAKESKVSIDDLCVSPIEKGHRTERKEERQEGELAERSKREAVDSTHKSGVTKVNTHNIPIL